MEKYREKFNDFLKIPYSSDDLYAIIAQVQSSIQELDVNIIPTFRSFLNDSEPESKLDDIRAELDRVGQELGLDIERLKDEALVTALDNFMDWDGGSSPSPTSEIEPDMLGVEEEVSHRRVDADQPASSISPPVTAIGTDFVGMPSRLSQHLQHLKDKQQKIQNLWQENETSRDAISDVREFFLSLSTSFFLLIRVLFTNANYLILPSFLPSYYTH